MRKVIGYVRVSSNGQVEGHGLDRQTDCIKEYCEKHDLDLIKVYRDEGISGTTQFRDGIQGVLNQDVKTVIIEKLDRLGRDLIVSETLIKNLKDNGIELISVEEGKNFDENPSRVLIRQILGSVSQFDKSNIVERLRKSREKIRKETGKCEGRKSYQEVGQHIIDKVKTLRRKPKGRKRLSFEKISGVLNEDGVVTITGKPFTKKIVGNICSQYL